MKDTVCENFHIKDFFFLLLMIFFFFLFPLKTTCHNYQSMTFFFFLVMDLLINLCAVVVSLKNPLQPT